MKAGALSLFLPPYCSLDPVTETGSLSARLRQRPGAALIWCLEEGEWGAGFDAVRSRPGGVALIVILPKADTVGWDPELLRVVEMCRPHSILPYHPEPSPTDLKALLCRAPDDLAIEVTDYLAWRGIIVDGDTRRLIRRTIELAGDVRSVSGLSRSLYLSRRALGRRFLTRGLPVPSHWLHLGRILRAVLRMQSTSDTLFSIACDLGYPDGFALSNQMYRLLGVRPTSARDFLGWEWLIEAWLRREAELGGLAPPVVDSKLMTHPKSMNRPGRAYRSERKPAGGEA